MNLIFADRTEAGKRLKEKIGEKLEGFKNTVILAIPRGGVPVAFQVAKGLKIPFHLVITKKLTTPQASEVAIGAIAPDGSYELNERIYSYFNPSKEEFENIKAKAREKVKRRIKKYTNYMEPVIKGKKVIIIDDGIATGYTALVAGEYAKNRGAKECILAVPVCPADSVSRMLYVFDDFIYVHSSRNPNFAVGAYYQDFHQNKDNELKEYLKLAKASNLLYNNLEKAEI